MKKKKCDRCVLLDERYASLEHDLTVVICALYHAPNELGDGWSPELKRIIRENMPFGPDADEVLCVLGSKAQR
jgi:hypothetical protein